MIGALLVMTGVTFGLRLLPFLFSKSFEKWAWLKRLGTLLPPCIIILLVVHCLETTAFGVAEAAGLLGVLILQVTFRNILLSMAGGVVIHQLLLHFL